MYFCFMGDVMFSHNGFVACHDKRNSQDFNQIKLNHKDQKNSLELHTGDEGCYL